MANMNPVKNDRGYQSARSNHSYTSGNKLGNRKTSGEFAGDLRSVKKTKTLHINDYKKFKKMRNVE